MSVVHSVRRAMFCNDAADRTPHPAASSGGLRSDANIFGCAVCRHGSSCAFLRMMHTYVIRNAISPTQLYKNCARHQI